MSKFEVYGKSISQDPWGPPVLETDDIEEAIELAYRMFDSHGLYSQIVATEEDNAVIFVDYKFIDDWELVY